MPPRPPSPYLEAVLARWDDRGALIRRDVDIMLEGLKVKGEFLDDFRDRVRKHRLEDIVQLEDARRQCWAAWDERIKRLETWMAASAQLRRASADVAAWRTSAQGFDRAGDLSRRYAATLEAKAARMEQQLVAIADRMAKWAERLKAKEADLRDFAERQSVKTKEVLVSKARKKPYLEFVFSEREEEGRIAMEFKNMRGSANRALERLVRADSWAEEKAKNNPAHFEARKTELMKAWQPFHKRFRGLRELVLQQALDFEESRRRLRWIYEQVQRMRVVQDALPVKRPLLDRLFRPED